MSDSFRPVIEKWGPHSSIFIDHDELIALINQIADSIERDGSRYAAVNYYKDVEVVWLQNGRKFLDFIASDAFTPEWAMQNVFISGDPNPADVASVIENMKGLASDWVNWLDSDGSLTFYVD